MPATLLFFLKIKKGFEHFFYFWGASTDPKESIHFSKFGASQWLVVKNLLVMQETWVRSLGQEDYAGEENSNSLQYSCLENPIDRGAWQAARPWGRKESDVT